MSTELDIIRRAELEQKIVSMYASTKSISEISKATGLTVKQVNEFLAEFKKYSMQDKVLREMSRETVIKTKLHYDELVQKMYSAVEIANDSGDYKAEMTGIKAIADIEKQRVDFMQKAGLLADNELGDQLIEAERKHSILVDIIKELMRKYPNVGLEFQARLKEVTGVLEGVPSERTDK